MFGFISTKTYAIFLTPSNSLCIPSHQAASAKIILSTTLQLTKLSMFTESSDFSISLTQFHLHDDLEVFPRLVLHLSFIIYSNLIFQEKICKQNINIK